MNRKCDLKLSRGLPAVIVALAIVAASCSGKESAEQTGGSERREIRFPVETLMVPAEGVEYLVEAVGSVEAFEEVQVTARVAGVVERVRFLEGDAVTEAQILAEIEPRRYHLSHESARAAFDKAAAAEAEAVSALKRREDLAEKNPGLLKDEELEAFRTRARVAAAEAAQAKSALALAELNLQDSYVRAPMPGIVQTRSVRTGQYVQPGAVMATIMRTEPLLLRFDVPEHEATRVTAGGDAHFQIRGTERTFDAAIVHVAAAADPGSRMVSITARVAQSDHPALRPGAFARIRVPVGRSDASVVIPQSAIRPSERGFLAFVIEDERARERILQTGMRTADGRVEVVQGLQAGEQLVVRGTEALRDGAPVRVAATPHPETATGLEKGDSTTPPREVRP
jgi:membrane fusion protein, multidrug efflux system